MPKPFLRFNCFLLPLLFLSFAAEAKRFRNAYVSFELPPNWSCNVEGTEWVCVSKYSKKPKEAIIILTAKEVGPTDSLRAYEQHLKSSRMIDDSKGKASKSKVIHVKQRNIANHPWIDGMHLGSEVPSYYTRYLGTVKGKIAILVTFSAHKTHYTKYSSDFNKAIQSLRVVASKDLMNGSTRKALRPGHETIGAPIGGHISSELMNDQYPSEETPGLSGSARKLLGLLIVIIAGITILYMRKRRKKKK